MSAYLSSVLCGQANPCCHGYFPCQIYVTLGQRWIFIACFVRQTEQNLNSLSSYTADPSVHGLANHSNELGIINKISLSKADEPQLRRKIEQSYEKDTFSFCLRWMENNV